MGSHDVVASPDFEDWVQAADGNGRCDMRQQRNDQPGTETADQIGLHIEQEAFRAIVVEVEAHT